MDNCKSDMEFMVKMVDPNAIARLTAVSGKPNVMLPCTLLMTRVCMGLCDQALSVVCQWNTPPSQSPMVGLSI